MKLSEIKPNPNNPRLVRDDKFKKLCQSIKSFPEMMALRPIIVDENNIIQGGNMRFKELSEMNYKDVPDEWIKQGKDLTPEQWKEFVIKDNVGFGEWNWEIITIDWETETLKDWGLDVPNWSAGNEMNEMSDEDVDITDEFDPIGEAKNLIKIIFIFDNDIKASEFYKKYNIPYQYKVMNGGTGGDSKVW